MGGRSGGESGRSALVRRVGTLCLRAFPRDFRQRHGTELLRLHRDLLRQRHGDAIPATAVAALAADLVGQGLAARWERLRDRRGQRDRGHLVDTTWQDIRFSARTLIKRPSFTVVAVLSLALGIAANAVVFAIVSAFILRPMPYEEPEELLHPWTTSPQGQLRASVPDFLDWKARSETFEDMAGFNYTIETLTGGEVPEQISGARVTANAFSLLGVEPVVGRGFAAGEDRRGAEPVAMISEGFRRERMSGQEVLGKTIEVGGVVHTIVGVVPEGTNFPLPTTEVWLPRNLDDPRRLDRDYRFMQVVARLAPGASPEQASDEMSRIAARLEEEHPETNEETGVALEPLRWALNFADEVIRPMSVLLLVAVGFVLAIACANVASLMLARATTRERELAVRAALGAGRRRLLRQLLTESLLLAVAGAAVGLLLAAWLSRGVDGLIPAELYKVGSFAIDGYVLAYTAALAAAAAVLAGLVPGLRASRRDLTESLKQRGGGSGDRGGSRLQGVMVAVEMALAIALLVGMALMGRSLLHLQWKDPGFVREGVLSIRMLLPESRYGDSGAVERFHRDLLERADALPAVVEAATVNHLPLNHEFSSESFTLVGRPPTPEPYSGVTRVVSPEYFEVMGLPLMAGRTFGPDDAAGAPLEVIVDATAVERFWDGEDPLGTVIELEAGARAEVVGVAAASRQVELGGAPEPILYYSQYQRPGRYLRLVLRSEGDPLDLVGPARAAIGEVDPLLGVSEIRTMAQVFDDFLLPQRGVVIALALLAAGALLLASVGVYGMMAFFVAQRTRELGIQMALGATAGRVRRVIVGRVLRLAGIAAVAGLVAAYGLGRLMSSQLYGVGGADPLAFGGATAFLLLVAVAAGLAGARRATRVDPITALRAD